MNEHLHATELGVVLASAFPVLAVAYYSASRRELDEWLVKQGVAWRVSMQLPAWAQHQPIRALVKFFANPKREDNKSTLILDERFRLSADRSFNFAFPLGFLLSIFFLVTDYRWALALGLVLVAWATSVLILYATQIAMVRMAHAIEQEQRASGRIVLTVPRFRFFIFPNRAPLYADEQPGSYLARASMVSVALMVGAIATAIWVLVGST